MNDRRSIFRRENNTPAWGRGEERRGTRYQPNGSFAASDTSISVGRYVNNLAEESGFTVMENGTGSNESVGMEGRNGTIFELQVNFLLASELLELFGALIRIRRAILRNLFQYLESLMERQ